MNRDPLCIHGSRAVPSLLRLVTYHEHISYTMNYYLYSHRRSELSVGAKRHFVSYILRGWGKQLTSCLFLEFFVSF